MLMIVYILWLKNNRNKLATPKNTIFISSKSGVDLCGHQWDNKRMQTGRG